MAKFINTRKAVSEIEDLIKNAGERLILILGRQGPVLLDPEWLLSRFRL